MNRTIRRSFQWSLVVALTVLLGGSPASAGWLRHKLKRHCCQPAISCCVVTPACPPPAPACCPVPAPPVCCEPPAPIAVPSVPCCDYSAVPSCCDDSGVSAAPMEIAPVDMSPSYDMGMPTEMGSPVEVPMEGTIVDDAMMAAPMTESPMTESYDQGTVIESASPAPAETWEQPEQPFNSAPQAAPPVPNETEPAPEPQPQPEPESEPAPEPTPEPAPDPTVDDSDDDLFGGSSDESMPAEEMPAEEMSSDDLFGGSDEPEPAQSSDMNDDDLFGGPSTDAPAEAENSTDDLFGNPPAEEGSDGMDDLFGDPPADGNDAAPKNDDQPSIDDLFGDAAPENDANIESMVSEESSMDDLFGTPETSEDLSEAPSQEPADDADSDFNIDDLFGETSTASNEAVASVEELPAPVNNTVQNTVEDTAEVAVQVVSKKVLPTDVLGETRSRTWIDNTGVYHVEGRLIEIAADHVRLLKANGRTCTVPNNRLCQADAVYVDSIREQADSSRLAMLTSK